eukprot:jgi/Chlat1/4932/Chrsp31S04853
MSAVASFVIVGKGDVPVYTAEFGTAKKDDAAHLHQFVLHAALDIVQEAAWSTNLMNLKVVDKFNDLLVSAWVSAGNARFLLLHDARNEDGIRNFFQEVHELYIKVLLNPFHSPSTPITSTVFDQRVRAYARKYL